MTNPSDHNWPSGAGQQPGQGPQYPYGPPPGQFEPPPGPQYGPPPGYTPPFPPAQFTPPEPLPTPAPRRGRGRAVAIAAAAVVLLGGGAATYVALSASNASAGSATPKGAVQMLVGDLNNSDLVGVLNDLPPGERTAIGNPLRDLLGKLKKNDVLRSDADLSRVSGVHVSATGLTFAAKTITINHHVQIVQLTGGRISMSADLADAPFTGDFLRAVAPHGVRSNAGGSKTVDVAALVRSSGQPVRIAAQQSDGRWYPSLLYTIADNVTTSSGLQAPAPADRIPAVGAASPDAAVRALIEALLAGDLQRVGELLSPDELAVVHDYGKLILDRLHYPAPGVTLREIRFRDTPISGGTRVALSSLAMTGPDGESMRFAIAGSCVDVTSDGKTNRFCSTDLLKTFGAATSGIQLTAEQRTALRDLLSGLPKAAGLDTTESGGRWYVSPVRSYFDLANALLAGLKGNDAKALLSLIGQR